MADIIEEDEFSKPPSDEKKSWILQRIIYILFSLFAGSVFVLYLLGPNFESVINFDRAMTLLKVFSILDNLPHGTFILNIAYLLSAITGGLACLLALLLCFISGHQDKSRNLAAALSIGCLVLSYMSFIRLFHIENIDLTIKILDNIFNGLFGLSLWFWILFLKEFPQKIPAEKFLKIRYKQLTNFDKWYYKYFFGEVNVGISKEINFRIAISNWIESYKGALALILVFVVMVGLFDNFIILFYILIITIGHSYMKIRVAYELVDEQSRKQISWLSLGMMLFFSLLVLTVLTSIFLGILGVSWLVGVLMKAIITIAAPLFWLIFILTLIISIFYHGSLDPRLVIKKSAVYGFMGVVLTTLFVAIEGSLQTHAILQFGLHDQTGAIITGTVAAVLFGPVRNKMEVKVEGFIDRILPVSALAEGKRRTSAIVFNDISGYTAISEKDEDAAFMLVSIIHQVGTKAALESRGRVVKTIGDAIMLELPTVEEALNAAKTLHEKYTQLSTQYKLPTLPIHTASIGEK